MHAIVMVHKMQRMMVSSHQLLPPKADSENTRNSEKTDSDDGPETGENQGDAPTNLDSTKNMAKHVCKTPGNPTQIHTHTHTPWMGDLSFCITHSHVCSAWLCFLAATPSDLMFKLDSSVSMWPSFKPCFTVDISASLQRNSCQSTDEAAGAEQQ